MSAFAEEWLNLLVRWVHVIAAIMWIGDSFLFMWLDSHLTAPSRRRDGEVAGELWMTHSGGFYEVVKRKSLRQDELPARLYWFKWESYTTWLSGFVLFVIVYHLNASATLLEPGSPFTATQAAVLSLTLLPAAVGLYELLWRTPLARHGWAFAAVGWGLIVALAYGLGFLLQPRAVFLQVGATVGTVMAANVFFRIIPAQKHMLAMTAAGKPVDTAYGLRAKGRSVHNHYLTLPVLFTMLSNHFPSTYGNPYPHWVLGSVVLFGAGLKLVMNLRLRTPAWAAAGTVAALVAGVALTRPKAWANVASAKYAQAPAVSFETVKTIIDARCVSCHAQKPASPLFAAPPQGVVLDSAEAIGKQAERIFVRATATRTMSLANMTAMSDSERDLLGAWFAQGANVHAPGPSQLQLAAQAPTLGELPPDASPEERAQAYYGQVCVFCHGAAGAGDGLAAAGLETKPRNFGDPSWQQGVNDEHLRKVIVEGGPAVGKSAVMPANPVLAERPEVVDALVKLIRSFGARP